MIGKILQSQVASYQRLWKWYLIPPCLTLSNIRYVSRVKWSNPGKGVAPSPTPRYSSYWKGSFLVTLDYSRQLYLPFPKRRCRGSCKGKQLSKQQGERVQDAKACDHFPRPMTKYQVPSCTKNKQLDLPTKT